MGEVRAIDRAQKAVSRRVLGTAGVTGTAQGLKSGAPCIKVYIEADDPRLRARLPSSANGFPVDVEVTGRVQRW